MRRLAIFLIPLMLAACGEKPKGPVVSKEPVSVRGWVLDVEGSGGGDNAPFRTVETEAARKIALFQSMNIWVEGAPYISGGLAENGSFILLDVPPGTVTIELSTPTIPQAKLVLTNVPGNADVLIPGVIVKKDGGIAVADPKAIEVRTAAKIDKPHVTAQKVMVAGIPIPVIETPLAQMISRRDWPVPPGSAPPVVTMK
ncbi:MAG TPA: hypothetical protein VJ901_07355 [Thermoanaerobaculia bacterium]|nr:hypothetical protein [Thermoanaerobaculia bacterium]